jgi:hypothetical protein
MAKKKYVYTAARKRAFKKMIAAARKKNVKRGKNKKGKG